MTSRLIQVLSLLLLTSQSSQASDSPERVYPRPLERFNSHEIGNLIYRLMQPKNKTTFPWAHMANGEIIWITDGFEIDDGVSYRKGALRVTVNGKPTTVLRQNVEELGWTIAYFTDNNPKWGAEYVAISPGRGDCFGTKYSGCSFDIASSLESTPLDYEQICENPSFRIPTVYRLKGGGKEPAVAIINTDGGSGGAQSSLYLSMTIYGRSNEKLCAPRYE